MIKILKTFTKKVTREDIEIKVMKQKLHITKINRKCRGTFKHFLEIKMIKKQIQDLNIIIF